MSAKTFGQGFWHRFFGHPEESISITRYTPHVQVEQHVWGVRFHRRLSGALFYCSECRRRFWKHI